MPNAFDDLAGQVAADGYSYCMGCFAEHVQKHIQRASRHSCAVRQGSAFRCIFRGARLCEPPRPGVGLVVCVVAGVFGGVSVGRVIVRGGARNAISQQQFKLYF